MKTIYIKQLFIALFLLIASAGMASAAQWQLKNGLGAETPLSFIPGSQDTLPFGSGAHRLIRYRNRPLLQRISLNI